MPGIEHVNHRRVVHGVIPARPHQALGGPGVKCFDRHLHRGGVAHTADARIEVGHVGLQARGRVPRRVDGDENRHHALRAGSEPFERVVHRQQRRRTHIGAVGVAERHQQEMTVGCLRVGRIGGIEAADERQVDLCPPGQDQRIAVGGAQPDRKHRPGRNADRHSEIPPPATSGAAWHAFLRDIECASRGGDSMTCWIWGRKPSVAARRGHSQFAQV